MANVRIAQGGVFPLEQALAGITDLDTRMAPEIWQRYKVLHAKLQGETISEVERQELLSLTEQMENIHAEWLRYVLELAQSKKENPKNIIKKINVLYAPPKNFH